MRNNESHLTEPQKFYFSYSLLQTIFHNYAVSRYLLKKKLYSWGINVGYYTLVFIGRLFVWFALGRIIKHHSELRGLLLRGNNSNSSPNLINELTKIEIMEKPNDRLSMLGRLLTTLSKIRNYNNYEHFIISHQLSHEKLEEKFEELSSVLSEELKSWVSYSVDVFLRYWSKNENFGYYVAMMEGKTENVNYAKIDKERKIIIYYTYGIKTTLDKLKCIFMVDGGCIVDEVLEIWEKRIDSYKNLSKLAEPSFYKQMTYFEYSMKNRKYTDFITYIRNFKDEIEKSKSFHSRQDL